MVFTTLIDDYYCLKSLVFPQEPFLIFEHDLQFYRNGPDSYWV